MAIRKRGSGRLPAGEAARIEERLLDAATKLFSRDGYGKTTMDGIAREAGASSKTLYSRYAGKAEILNATVRRVVEQSTPEALNLPADARDPRRYLHAVGRQLAALTQGANAGLNRLVAGEAHQFPELAKLGHDTHGAIAGRLREAIEGWVAAGLLPTAPPPGIAARLFLEMSSSLARGYAHIGRPFPARERNAYVDEAVELFLRGCGYRAADGG